MARIKPQALLQQSKKKKGHSKIGASTLVLYGLIVLVMVFFMFATFKHWTRRSTVHSEDGLPNLMHDDAFVGSDIPRYAIFNTSKGAITVELYKEGSPEVVDEFIESCQMGHFRGMSFNRVIKNFVIQGGDSEIGVTEDWTSKGKHYNNLDARMKHEAFMIGTSKGKHGKKGFQLFITTAPIPDLNEKLNVFGRVIKGEDVVQRGGDSQSFRLFYAVEEFIYLIMLQWMGGSRRKMLYKCRCLLVASYIAWAAELVQNLEERL